MIMKLPTKPDLKALKSLSDHIRTLHKNNGVYTRKEVHASKQFNITSWNFECGMPACVGGHAAYRFPRRLRITNNELYLANKNSTEVGYYAFAKAFGIIYEQSKRICNPVEYNVEVTPEVAAERINEVIKEIRESE